MINFVSSLNRTFKWILFNNCRRLLLLAIWQLVFLLHIFVLIGVVVLGGLALLPNLHYVSETAAAPGVPGSAVSAAIVGLLAGSAALIPFHFYSFRLVNGAKLVLAEIQLEHQATQASRIMVRRHSEPANLSSTGGHGGAGGGGGGRVAMGLTFARELLGVTDRLSQSVHVSDFLRKISA